MANSGIKASSAGTALRTGLSNMAKPTKQMAAYMDRYGISLQTNADGSVNLRDTMEHLREKMGGLSTTEQAAAASAIFGKNAMSGWLSIINASDQDFEKLTGAIDNCDGTAEEMALTMQDNLAGQITILKSALQELAIQIGDALMPTVRKIVEKIQDFVLKLQQMDEGTRNTILKVAAFAAAIGPALLVVGKLTTGVGKAMQAFSSIGRAVLTFVNQAKLGVGIGGKLAAAIGGISAPVAAVIAVVALLVAAFVHLWKTNEEFRNKITGIWDGIKAKFAEAGQKITEAINKLGFDFKDITEAMKAAWDGLCNALAPILEGVFKALGEIIEGIIDVVTGVIEVIVGLISGFKDGDWSTFTQGLLDIINGIVNAIWGVIQGLFHMFGVELDDFDGDWEAIWTGIKDFFTAIWEAIAGFFTGIWEGIKNTVSTVVNAIGTAISTAWNAVKTTFETVWNAIAGVVSTVWETIKNVVQVGIMFIKELFSAAFQIITLPFRFIWENCRDTVIALWEAIKSAVSTALDAIKTTIAHHKYDKDRDNCGVGSNKNSGKHRNDRNTDSPYNGMECHLGGSFPDNQHDKDRDRDRMERDKDSGHDSPYGNKDGSLYCVERHKDHGLHHRERDKDGGQHGMERGKDKRDRRDEFREEHGDERMERDKDDHIRRGECHKEFGLHGLQRSKVHGIEHLQRH